ncbi:hypothetical protein OENI_10046 [Oenococcus oeni]|nr:hypothetical protein OENI_10100 [Oenococcus oeni]SYV99252.1 hypothetical protein OENI_1170035 [Oenococcus oeni]SYW00335.1 hypothetical protein OENI_10046 [Oenococcus oeni]SYW07124.1 hypothetical protein OENI_10025 [Oenococcus oeni]SYW07457.1 hypothetical protein OENI_70041 [Oenococcus oeni]
MLCKKLQSKPRQYRDAPEKYRQVKHHLLGYVKKRNHAN